MFLYGFAKKEPDNIDAGELLTLRGICAARLNAAAARMDQVLAESILQRLELLGGNSSRDHPSQGGTESAVYLLHF